MSTKTVTAGLEIRPNSAVDYSPFNSLKSGWRNRALIWRLTRQDIESRYKGTYFGLLWSALIPLLMLLVYTFVFSYVFQARWSTEVESKGFFSIVLFSGLVYYNFFAEALLRAPTLMLTNPSYVKKVVFPLEILPWVILITALFNFGISFLVLLIAHYVVLGLPPVDIFLFPLTFLPLFLVTLGLTLFTASIGVFVRDLGQFMGVVTTVFLFLTPIFYPLTAVPEELRSVVLLSPLTIAVESFRDLLFFDAPLAFGTLAGYSAAGMLTAWLGHVWFMKTKKGFADVL